MTLKQMLLHVTKHAALGVLLVVAYSPGFLCLRPNDPSILRAGCSILILPAVIGAFVYLNRHLLGFTIPMNAADIFQDNGDLDNKNIQKGLEKSTAKPYIGDLAKTALEQAIRLEKLSRQFHSILTLKFSKGTLSYHKYENAIAFAEDTLLKNQARILSAIDLFDPEEYRRLLDYQNDNLPDEPQIEQLNLYNKNQKHIKQAIADTETLLAKLYTLLLTINDSLFQESEESNQLITEIETLAKELDFYNA